MHLIKKQTEKIQPNLTQRISFQIIHMKGLFYHHEKKEKSGKIIISKSIWVKGSEYIVNLFYMIKFHFQKQCPPPQAKVWPQCIYALTYQKAQA